jgi:MtrB/PioB family decaheme-associated outer membrane protein
MKTGSGLVRTCVIGAVLSGMGLVSTGMPAQAADTDMPMKAPAAAPVPYWWFHGDVEAGGRFFLNNPQRNGSAYLGQDSLAKFYEYRDLRPGPFANFWLSTGTSDGLYRIDVGGKNVGYEDQSYYLNASKAGQVYFNFDWDQTPHLYSTSAQTFYQGVGTTSLTLPPGFVRGTNTTSSATLVPNPFLNQTDIGIKRDTGSAQIRWTPDDAWDIKADYSHLYRSGTQVDGVVGFGPSFGYGPTQVPRPVDDTTQNFGANGEYVGTSPWGKRFNLKVAYNGSIYTDNMTSYTIADPFSNGLSGTTARESTWPSNNANAFSGTLGADLPWNSRYAGTLNYTMMRQNDSFIPMSTQDPTFPLPASSLNGAINTLLSNNIITTKITPELTNKITYRYYNFDNQTPMVQFLQGWISYDQAAGAGGIGTEAPISSLSMQYVKQNFSEGLNWRPTKEWNLGAEYTYERYDWTQADVNYTNENGAKVYADWKPTSWVTLRASGLYSERRYGTYDYTDYVANVQFPQGILAPVPSSNSFFYSSAYRQLFIDNRDRAKVNLLADIVVAPGLLVTPTFKYQDDKYNLNNSYNVVNANPNVGPGEEGLQESRSWSAGIDATYKINADTSFTVGYMYESYYQLLYNCSCGGHGANLAIPTTATAVQTSDNTIVNTLTAAVRWAAIPTKLDTELRYTVSRGVDTVNLTPAPTAASGGQFPDYTTWFQRLDAIAIYTFDKSWVNQLGWKGEVKAKLHYAWEKNAISNWANDPVAPYDPTFASGSYALFMALDNPNYNVQMLMASLEFKW